MLSNRSKLRFTFLLDKCQLFIARPKVGWTGSKYQQAVASQRWSWKCRAILFIKSVGTLRMNSCWANLERFITFGIIMLAASSFDFCLVLRWVQQQLGYFIYKHWYIVIESASGILKLLLICQSFDDWHFCSSNK